MKKYLILFIFILLSGCSVSVKKSCKEENKPINDDEYKTIEQYCKKDEGSHIVMKEGMPYCNNGTSEYKLPIMSMGYSKTCSWKYQY